MMELKMVLRGITILIGVAAYIGVWVSMVKNWDKCMRTGYAYPCVEGFLGEFYSLWITLHVFGAFFLLVWAWL